MSERSRQSLSHPEFSPDCTVLIVTGGVGPVLKRVKPVKQRLTHPLLFPQEFRLIKRDRMGTSRCLCLNHMERLPSRGPGSPGILPHQVLQSFNLPRFEVLPSAPRVRFWMTSAPDLQLRPCTRSSPCCTADYNPALSCHHHTPSEGFDPSRCQWEHHWCPGGYTIRVHRNRRATGGVDPGVQLSFCQCSYSSLHRQVSCLPRGSLLYADRFPTCS